jgi:hypothetical protein
VTASALAVLQPVSAAIGWGNMCVNTFLDPTCTEFKSDASGDCGMHLHYALFILLFYFLTKTSSL